MSDTYRSSVIAATVAVCRPALAEFMENTQKMKALDERQQAIREIFTQAEGTGKLFNFDLKEELQAAGLIPGDDAPADSGGASLPPAPAQDAKRPIREIALEMVERAYPGPIKAADIRAELEKVGRTTHYKTIGMTLYRLSVDRIVKRRGINWFFVPEGQRAKETPGHEPGGVSPDNDGGGHDADA